MRRSLIPMLLALIAAGHTGCGGDEEQASTAAPAASPKPAVSATTTAESASPTRAELRNLPCRKVEFGLTSTDTIYLVSAVSSEAGVDINTAAETVEDVCRRSKPRTKPYLRAVRILGGGS